MRIESVTAVAFGPFKGLTLEFSPQLTIVYGPNEAGKSSWHDAVYVSLCGMRRARGQLAEDRDFSKLRRPWGGDTWEVRAVLRLDNGRRIELRQDLSDLAHCSAIDADLGRDVAAEILNEGTPDAARWLGLDRRSFLAVACVRQGEIQSLVEDADSLQDDLQRAAASAARDSTAPEAIAWLEGFQREQVGQDLRNSTKPLRRAKVRAEEAAAAVASAREKHAEWLGLEAQLLRVGLAERLATTGETCPLILDDALVQSDRGRKRALLGAVLSISGNRQVILFTQEDEVLRWAQSNLTTPNRSVVLQAPEDDVCRHA